MSGVKLLQIGTTWGQVASCGILGLGSCTGMLYTPFASTAPINILADYLQAGLTITDVCLMIDLRNAPNSPRKFGVSLVGVDILDKIIAKKALTPNDCQLTESESNECPEFATSKAKAILAGMPIAEASRAIVKLCSFIGDVPTREAINTKLDNSNFARAKVRAFFEDILVTAPDDKYIGHNTNISKINVDIIKAWDIVFLAKGTLNYKLDFLLLEQIVTMQNNTSLMQKLGGNAGLIDIIAKNIRAGCNTCNPSSAPNLKIMSEYLQDVQDLATKYGANTLGYDLVLRDLKSSSTYNVLEPSAYTIKVIRAESLNIQDFEQLIGGCQPDARLSNGTIVECKSWTPRNADVDEEDALLKYDNSKSSFWNLSHGYGSYGQFLCYLRNTISMDKLQYYFDREKLTRQGQTDPDGYVKGIFQTLFTNKAQDIFDNLGQAKFTQLFGVPTVSRFLSEKVPQLSGANSIYGFINVR